MKYMNAKHVHAEIHKVLYEKFPMIEPIFCDCSVSLEENRPQRINLPLSFVT